MEKATFRIEDAFFEQVKKNLKPAKELKEQITVKQLNLLHLALGISGEAGEIADAIKKHVMYGKELDYVNVLEELGDLFFYMAGLMQELNLPFRDVLDHNIAKLSLRYPEGYTDAAAINRADKQ